ncbi:right-handed parallel beta-helix repeat-containing protein [Bacillus sp. JJ1764]|uniref:right-handed parallel beta-helix repeat-containing protein n=1 Tax=Bacillus sp. JJ1764 TaxID=3122964 RepID=UPI002FFF4C4F
MSPQISQSSYVLELDRWGVSNTVSNFGDKTLSTNNSNGINNAIVWASQQGYTEFVFPRGVYLIDETIPIQPQSFMTLNLGGSTLRIRNNGLASYSVISFKQNQMFSRVTNGIIQGDRYNHDYTTPGQAATHEWGMGILFPNVVNSNKGEGTNTRFISIDNIEFLDLTGDAVSLFATGGAIYTTTTPTKSYKITFESGSINTKDGSLIADSTKIRSNIFIDLTNSQITNWKYFGVYGDISYQSLGSEIDGTVPFDIIFYNSNGTYNSSITNVEFFDEIPLPDGATSAKIVLHQANIPSSTGNGLTLRSMTIPKFTFIEKCHIHHNRRLGVALQGAKFVWVKNNDIHHISGTGPSAALDVEDNYALNQNLWIEDNFLHDSPLQLIFVRGKNFHIKNNKIERGIGITGYPGVSKLYINGNYFKDTSVNINGECIIDNNILNRTGVTLNNGTTDPALVDNNNFLNSSLSVNRPKAYSVTVSNCKFTVDSDYSNAISGAGFSAGTYPQTMANCLFEGFLASSSVIFNGDENATEGWAYNNILFNNTKKPNNNAGIKIPRGTYINCKFNNTGILSPNKHVEFIGCTFIWNGYNLFNISNNELARFVNCYFYGGSNSAFYFSAVNKAQIDLINNQFDYTSATSSSISIIDGYWYNITGGKLLVDGNRFKSNLAIKAINSSIPTSDQFEITFINNTLEGAINFLVDITQIPLFRNNTIGNELDPYNWSTTVPTMGYYKLGKQILNRNMASDGFMGWVCIKEGFAETYPTWQPSKIYNTPDKISVNGYIYYSTVWNAKSSSTMPNFPTNPLYSTVKDIAGISTWKAKTTYSIGDKILPSSVSESYYECTTAGTTGNIEPSWGTASTITDGTVVWTKRNIQVWKLLGSKASFKKFGILS